MIRSWQKFAMGALNSVLTKGDLRNRPTGPEANLERASRERFEQAGYGSSRPLFQTVFGLHIPRNSRGFAT